VGSKPVGLLAGHFIRGAPLDLAVLEQGTQGDVLVLQGKGDGTFPKAVSIPVASTGWQPIAFAAGDFNEDSRLDFAVLDQDSVSSDPATTPSRLTIYVNNGQDAAGNVTFGQGGTVQVGSEAVEDLPVSLVVGDFDEDGHLDIASAALFSTNLSIALGTGTGDFKGAQTTPIGYSPYLLAAGDFNGDNHLDLAVGYLLVDFLSIRLGEGNGTFLDPGQASASLETPAPVQGVPLVADFTGDGVPDVAVLRSHGRILLRQGRAGSPGVFEPPTLVNPPPLNGGQDFPARDVAVVSRNGQVKLAALDSKDSMISFYAFDRATGTFLRTPGPTVPSSLPVRIIAGDLNGDGREDLVVAAADSDQVFVYLQDAAGNFPPTPTYRLGVGGNPAALALVDVNGDKRPDIVVADRFSGDVSVLLNGVSNPFATLERFRAGSGPYALGQLIGTNFPTVQSGQGTVAVAAGNFE
jgi:hypothetical protein